MVYTIILHFYFRPKPPPRASFKDESALKRKSEHGSDGMSSKNQRVDDLEDVPMDSDEPTTCDLIVLGLSWKVCISLGLPLEGCKGCNCTLDFR